MYTFLLLVTSSTSSTSSTSRTQCWGLRTFEGVLAVDYTLGITTSITCRGLSN